MPKSKKFTNFRLSEKSLQKLDEIAPPEMSFRARIELAIHYAWKYYQLWGKWFNENYARQEMIADEFPDEIEFTKKEWDEAE